MQSCCSIACRAPKPPLASFDSLQCNLKVWPLA